MFVFEFYLFTSACLQPNPHHVRMNHFTFGRCTEVDFPDDFIMNVLGHSVRR